MTIVLPPNSRVAYASQEGDEFVLSPFAEARQGRRPMIRFDTQEQLEDYAASRQHRVVWLTN